MCVLARTRTLNRYILRIVILFPDKGLLMLLLLLLLLALFSPGIYITVAIVATLFRIPFVGNRNEKEKEIEIVYISMHLASTFNSCISNISMEINRQVTHPAPNQMAKYA